MTRKLFQTLAVASIVAALTAGCASSQIKARKDLREKNSQTSKLYCDFVNGDIYPDVEVQLNLEMAKRCDSEKSFTATSYRTSNENMGIVYCCALHDEHKAEVKKTELKTDYKTEIKSEAKKTEAKADVKKGTVPGATNPPAAPVGVDELGD